MVLTNFECWANGSSAANVSVDIEHQLIAAGVASRHVDPFNPRVVQQQNLGPAPHAPSSAADVSHISSNGYYGFSYVNAAHELNNNNNINYNNLNAAPRTRCKKRIFVNDDDLFANIAASCAQQTLVAASDSNDYHEQQRAAAKRCRYDDGFTEQYFNDFFNMQDVAASTPPQIGTNSCLMDTEDYSQPLPAQQHHPRAQEQEQQQQQQEHQLQHPAQQQVDATSVATSLHTNFAPKNVECNFGATNAIKTVSNQNSVTNQNSNKSMQSEVHKNIENLNSFTKIGDPQSGSRRQRSLLLPAAATNAKLETLFAATHGGSRYHYWLHCKSKSSDNTGIGKSDENFYEEF